MLTWKGGIASWKIRGEKGERPMPLFLAMEKGFLCLSSSMKHCLRLLVLDEVSGNECRKKLFRRGGSIRVDGWTTFIYFRISNRGASG